MGKKDKLYVVLILGAILFVAGGSQVREVQDAKELPDWTTLIRSEVEKERTSAREIVLLDRKERIEKLLSVVNSPVQPGEAFYSSTTSRNISIFLLGQLRAKEAVPTLMEWLFPRGGQALIRGELLMFSHAGYALVEIGLPSVPPLIELLASEADAAEREQAIKIVVSIKGLRETEVMFEELLASERDSAKKEKLEVVQATLQKPKLRKTLEKLIRRRGSR
jgi:hypothetical protein